MTLNDLLHVVDLAMPLQVEECDIHMSQGILHESLDPDDYYYSSCYQYLLGCKVHYIELVRKANKTIMLVTVINRSI